MNIGALDVYAIGNALVDIQIQVPDSVIAELGCDKGCRYPTQHLRQQEILKTALGSETLDNALQSHRIQTAAGGSAANTVHGMALLGGQVGFCGKWADDRFGSLFTTHLQQNAIVFRETHGQGMTGSCVVLVTDDAQRTMFTCLGVSGEVDSHDINEDCLAQSRLVYLEGYFLENERTLETLLQAIAIAKQHNVSVALTASDAFCVDRHRDLFVRLIQHDVDWLFANALEAQRLSRANTVEAAVRVLSGWCNHVVVTNGAQGSLLSCNGELLTIPAVKISAVDTTGAGDAYAAGMLYGMTHGRTPRESGSIASLFAAQVATTMGPHCTGTLPPNLVGWL